MAASQEVCGISELASRAHPPLGKWLIGSGIALFGYQPFGWRVAAAVAGIVTVVLVYLLAWRLFRPMLGGRALIVGAGVSAGLLATDFLHSVHSRVAMLDVFMTMFVVAAVLAIVLDRDRARERSTSWLSRVTWGRPCRLLAGACLGAATATKWSGGYVALALVALTVAWEIAAVRRAGGQQLGWQGLLVGAVRREALPTVVLLGVVPALVYLASYTGRMPGALLALPWEIGSVWRGIYDHQFAMAEFHASLGGHHPYESPPWSWPLLRRPVAYFFLDEGGTYRHILALGNPLVWWTSILAIAGLAVRWLLRGADVMRPEAVIVIAALATFGPWLLLSGARSQVFLWYLLPTVPFMCLALGLLAARLWGPMTGRLAVAAYAVLVVGSFAFYAPLLTALPIEPGAWRQRILFTDCERQGAPTLTLPDDQVNRGPPPDGWCWI